MMSSYCAVFPAPSASMLNLLALAAIRSVTVRSTPLRPSVSTDRTRSWNNAKFKP